MENKGSHGVHQLSDNMFETDSFSLSASFHTADYLNSVAPDLKKKKKNAKSNCLIKPQKVH